MTQMASLMFTFGICIGTTMLLCININFRQVNLLTRRILVFGLPIGLTILSEWIGSYFKTEASDVLVAMVMALITSGVFFITLVDMGLKSVDHRSGPDFM